MASKGLYPYLSHTGPKRSEPPIIPRGIIENSVPASTASRECLIIRSGKTAAQGNEANAEEKHAQAC